MPRDAEKTKSLAPPLKRIVGPFQEFIHTATSGGIVLIACAVLALVWANSPWAETYHDIWQGKLSVSIRDVGLSKPVWLWINDGLMAAFFFVVGLEIKREVITGELSSLRSAALPLSAALGGMIVPAGIYLLINPGEPAARGWGIPMATDIAFALGILALLGDRVPLSAKVFLTAVAIVDDIGASLVIALFYTESISWTMLAVAALFWAGQIAMNIGGVLRPTVYLLFGIGLWMAFLKSGVHPTIAGILGAIAIPAFGRIDSEEYLQTTSDYLHKFEQSGEMGSRILASEKQIGILQAVANKTEQAQAPLQRLEHGMHPWVSFAIIPLFALANAGVFLGGAVQNNLSHPVTLGIIAGLVVGKPIGIFCAAWLVVKLGIAELPRGLTWRHVFGLGCLAGIGFTMSLFIGGLAFGGTELFNVSKVSILAASLIAGLAGWLILRRAS